MPVKSASRASPGAITPATTKGRMRGVSRPSSDVVDSVTVQTTAVVKVTDSTAAGSGSTYWSARLRKMPATPKPNAADSARSGVNRYETPSTTITLVLADF